MENILYYSGLYLIVVLVKTAKLVKKYDPSDLRKNWTEILEVSLDLTFTASGCIIALLLNVDKSWIPVVYILSTIILLISAFMEFLSDRMLKIRPWLNGLIICLIFYGTFFLFNTVIPDVDSNGNKKQHITSEKKMNNYIVVIPYKDESLIGNFGYNKIGNKNFLYKVELNDTAEVGAKNNAILKFKSDSTILPVIKSKNSLNVHDNIKMSESEILVFKLQ